MTRKAAARLFGIFAAAILLAPFSLPAQESPPPLAEMWVLTPKADHSDELQEAIKEHMAFRKKHGDPRSWEAYTPVLGERLSRVAIRYCCIEWADVDAYREWSMGADEINAHFDEHVAPHVGHAAHYFESIDWANSHWNPGAGGYRLYAVTEFHLKPGHTAEFNAALDKMSQIAIEQGWASDTRNWLWMSSIGGSPRTSVVIPHRDYASFAQSEDTFFRFLAEQLNSEEKAAELLRQFGAATTGSDFQIWVHRTDLSMARED